MLIYYAYPSHMAIVKETLTISLKHNNVRKTAT